MAKVLVVDDNEQIRMALRVTLEDEGHEIVEAADGLEALDLSAEESPDLVLLDIGMPRMDGIEALKRLKAFSVTRNIPVVMVTALNDRETVATAVKLGLRDYIVKPWSTDDLIEIVDAAIESRDAEERQSA